MARNRVLGLSGTRSDPRAAGERLLGSRWFKATGVCLMLGFVAVFEASLLLRPEPVYSPLWDGVISNIALLLPALACFTRAILGGPRRIAAAWLGVGMLSFAVGNVIFVWSTALQADPPVPSPADIAFLGIYPAAAAALVCLVRREGRSLSKSLWLDGALGSAGAATLLALVLNPVLSGIEGNLAEVLVGAAFPVADLLLIAMICGLVASRGLRDGSMWLWLAGGFVIFCAADVVYALRLASETYVVGTILDGLWVPGLVIVAVALWRRERALATDPGRSTAILAIPMVATLVAVVVLVVSSFEQQATVVIALATFTLGLAAVRTFLGFQQVQRHSDAHRQALTDELTGVGNRRHLFEFGERRLQAADATERIALMMVDLDNFKEINDAVGHQGGDDVLRETARRLAAHAGAPDLLVRLGGDKFALVLTLAPGQDGPHLAERILDDLSRPLVVYGASVRVNGNAGVAECTGSTDGGVADLLRRADVAMYAARAGDSRVVLYDPQLDEENRNRVETAQDLDAAIGERQFVLHYQPKVDVGTGALIGAEALVRWQHPTRGLLYPDSFLPCVEQSGLMGALTRVVLDAAVAQLATWSERGLTLTVAVNLSASDLLDEHLAGWIEGLLAEHAVPVSALELEITESVLMTDPERAHVVLERLRALGLRIAVDDYGTGYCSLAYLRDFPVDELKIDRSFVAHVTEDPRSAAIVRSTVELAHALDLEVVAEGVEHVHALDALAAFGCDFAQGYHFSRPLPADELATWAHARAADDAPAIGAVS